MALLVAAHLGNSSQRGLVVSLRQSSTSSTTGSWTLSGGRRLGLKWDLVFFAEWGRAARVRSLPSHDLPSPTGKAGWNGGGGGITIHSLPSFQESRKSLLGYNISFPRRRIVKDLAILLLINIYIAKLQFLALFICSGCSCAGTRGTIGLFKI